MEPVSIISIIFQLATITPEINRNIIKQENFNLSRTQVIEFYRSNMKPDIEDKGND